MLKKNIYSKVLDTEFPKRFADSINTSETFWSQELFDLMKILWALRKKTPRTAGKYSEFIFMKGTCFNPHDTQPPSQNNCDDLGLF